MWLARDSKSLFTEVLRKRSTFLFPSAVSFQTLFSWTEIKFSPAHTFYLQRSMPFLALNVPRETAIFMKNSWEVSHETKIWKYLADADIKLSKIREKFHVKHY